MISIALNQIDRLNRLPPHTPVTHAFSSAFRKHARCRLFGDVALTQKLAAFPFPLHFSSHTIYTRFELHIPYSRRLILVQIFLEILLPSYIQYIHTYMYMFGCV